MKNEAFGSPWMFTWPRIIGRSKVRPKPSWNVNPGVKRDPCPELGVDPPLSDLVAAGLQSEPGDAAGRSGAAAGADPGGAVSGGALSPPDLEGPAATLAKALPG